MGNPLGRIEEKLLDLFFPRYCLGCGNEGSWVCVGCKNKTLEKAELVEDEEEGLRVASFFDFREPLIREMLHNLKYNGIREVAGIFKEMIKEKPGVMTELDDASMLIPVPTSKAKLKMRGYNQAEELARGLGGLFELPVVTNLLVRVGKKASQVGKGREERAAQVEGLFSVNEKAIADMGDKTCIVVDDLYTTGSTVKACVAALDQKVRSVRIMTIAREY